MADSAVREPDVGDGRKVSSHSGDSHQHCSSERERGGGRASGFEGRT